MHLHPVVPFLVVGILCHSRSLPAEDDPRVASLREHAVVLRTITPDDDDFTDLQSLKKLLQDVRIVQLGEQTHGDGATFHAKTRLIRFLHREMGFDVIAFESGLYDCRKAWEQFAAGADPREAAEQGIFGIWTHSEQIQPLLKYIAAAAKTEHPLELCGFDCQFTAAASRTTLASDFHAFVESLPDEPVYRDNIAVVAELLGKPVQHWSTPEDKEQKRVLTAFQ
jgi:erythromycin esterase